MDAVNLIVRNDSFSDVKVYAVVGGNIRTRIGRARGLTTSTFALRTSHTSAGWLTLELQEFAGDTTVLLESLNIEPYVLIRLDIAARLQQSSVWPVR